MKWASAISAESRLESAVKDAAVTIKQQLEGQTPDWVAMFVSRKFADRYEEATAMLADRLPARVMMGAGAAGLIGDGHELESHPGVSVTAAVLPGVTIHPFALSDEDMPDLDASPRAWEKWVGVSAASQPQFLFLADPFSFRTENFILGMDYAFPRSPKIGGLASGASQPGKNALYIDQFCFRNGLVGVAFSGNIELNPVVAQGCRPIGDLLRITACSENILMGVNGKPPLELLQALFNDLSDRDRRLMRQALFVGLAMSASKEQPQQGDFLIRNVLGLDDRTGALAVGSALRVGQTIQFHLRDSRRSNDDLRAVFEQAGDRVTGTRGALLFSCVGRGKSLYGRPNHDSAFFTRAVGAVPLGGFFCNGEIGPVNGTTYLHGYTSSFGLFRPKS